MKIRIRNDKGVGFGTSILTDDGVDISNNVSTVDIRIRPDEIIVACVEIGPLTLDVLAELCFTEEHLRDIAGTMGYDVIPIGR